MATHFSLSLMIFTFRHTHSLNIQQIFSFSQTLNLLYFLLLEMGAKTNGCPSSPPPQPQRRRPGRRKWPRFWPLLPLLFVWGLILCSFPISLIMYPTPVPGSVYRSHQLFRALRPRIHSDNSTPIQLSKVWKYKKLTMPRYCTNSPIEGYGQSGYLIVEANGGLNQQRSSICNAVANAGLLNATLVIPQFEYHNVWRDPRVIRIAPFANRLAMNIPPRIQVLRCLANYKALRFAPPISILAKQLVKRMVRKSPASDGKYVAIHLRFEEDMVAFSCCVYDGGREERVLMNKVREKGWGGNFRHRSDIIDPGLNRITGKCPLSPIKVGMMLRAMGFDNKTTIYLASGILYQAKEHLAPLLEMFPLVYTKESLATTRELEQFKGYSSRLAALDYAVCLFSEVFATTHGGNFPHFLTGHRKFIYGGHAKTINPNKMKLVQLFHDSRTSWEELRLEMKRMLVESNRVGMMAPHIRKSRRKASIYQYPFPD